MIKTSVAFLFIFIFSNSFCQEKVEWSSDFDNTTCSIHVKATIAEGWHLYSQHIDDGIGPVPTALEFTPSKIYKLIGETEEPESIREYDENFEGELNFFKDEVVFTQKVAIKKSGVIEGTITYMLCNDTMCLPPVDKPFQVKIEAK